MEWRAVPNFEYRYEVSDEGFVRNIETGLVLKHAPRGGYPTVALCKGQHRYRYIGVHQLVLEVFVGPRPEGLVARHLDGDYQNCVLRNLRYGTPSENMMDAVRHGTHANASKTHCKQGHEFSPDNTYHSRNGWRTCKTCQRAAVKRYHQRKGEDN